MALMFRVLALAAGLLTGISAHGATDVYDPHGTLLGVDGVDVNGTAYDVRFEAGTCIGVFGGCTRQGAFAFSTQDDALAASRNLLEQGFLEPVGNPAGSDPFHIAGIQANVAGRAWLITPYAINGKGLQHLVLAQVALVQASGQDSATPCDCGYWDWQPTQPTETYAIWSAAAVPEPGTWTLLGAGLVALLGLLGMARRPHRVTPPQPAAAFAPSRATDASPCGCDPAAARRCAVLVRGRTLF